MKYFSHLSLIALLFVAFSGLFSSDESFARGNASILRIAKSQIGVREYRGRGSNPRITRYFRKAVGRSYSDSMPWCSAFMNYVTKTAGHGGTNSLSARSWARWGRRTRNPRPGDIVVFSRRRGGHVGVFLGFAGNRVRVIGGNQSNSVSVKTYSRRTVISYRTSGAGSSRSSKTYAKSRSKTRRYRTARSKLRRSKRNKLRRAKRSLARRIAANQRRRKRLNKARATKRYRVAKLKRKKRYKKKAKKQYYQQPQYYIEPATPAARFNTDGTLS